MTSYDSMRAKLLPTGLYRLDGSSAVDSELRAYAAELDRVCAALDELLREAFIATAETYGITERERFFGRLRPDLTIEQRRALLLQREVGESGCGLADLEAVIASCGVTDCSVTLNQRHCKIDINVNDPLTAAQKNDLEARVGAFDPPTFETIFHYET